MHGPEQEGGRLGGKAERTRSKILDAAQEVVLSRGFAAASVDAIQEAAGISRGTFFYHFATKADLSRALIERYAASDRTVTDGFMKRAEKLVRDPVQQVLVFLALHEELFDDLTGIYPGCLFASYSYEAGLFDDETRAIVDEAVQHWRDVLGGKLEEAIERHPLALPSDPYVLADLAYGVFQGAFILSRLREDTSIMVQQLRQLRHHFELQFGLVDGMAVATVPSVGSSAVD